MSKSKVVVKEEDKTNEEDWTYVDDMETCAACRHINSPCPENCLLAPYFPANEADNYEIVEKVFGRTNLIAFLESLPADRNDYRRRKGMKNLIAEAYIRLDDPVNGCYGMLMKQQLEIEKQANQILSLNQRLDQLRNLGGHYYQNLGGQFYQNLGVFIENCGDPSNNVAAGGSQGFLRSQIQGYFAGLPFTAPTYQRQSGIAAYDAPLGNFSQEFPMAPSHRGQGQGMSKMNQFKRMMVSRRRANSG